MTRNKKAFASAISLAALGCLSLWTDPVHATYSIVAGDTEAELVGAAGTSCVARSFGWSVFEEIYGSEPGRGAYTAQGWLPLDPVYGQLASTVLASPLALSETITVMNYVYAFGASKPAYDFGQFGAVTLDAGGSSDWLLQFTNSPTDPVYGGSAAQLSGAFDVVKRNQALHGFRYAIQANLMSAMKIKKNKTAADMVVASAEKGFLKSKKSANTNLLDRLVSALDQAAMSKSNGEDRQGDKRCMERAANDSSIPIAGDSAFVQVESVDGPVAQIIVDDSCPDASNCVSAVAATKLFYRLCRTAFRNYLEDGASSSSYERYMDNCFVRVDQNEVVSRGLIHESKPNQPLNP